MVWVVLVDVVGGVSKGQSYYTCLLMRLMLRTSSKVAFMLRWTECILPHYLLGLILIITTMIIGGISSVFKCAICK